MSVSTTVWTKLPAAEVPAWATKSTSTRAGGGSFQSPNVRTGTARRTVFFFFPCARKIGNADQ
jgi:hypothetical protein